MKGPLAALPLWSILLAAPPGPSPQEPFQVIVNAQNPVAELASDEVQRLFLRTARTFRGGPPAQPVDQSLSSPVRIQFAREVLGQTRGEVQDYWLKRMFSGREVPPPVLGSDQDVIEFVRANEGGIGYVSPSGALPAGVKPVRLAR